MSLAVIAGICEVLVASIVATVLVVHDIRKFGVDRRPTEFGWRDLWPGKMARRCAHLMALALLGGWFLTLPHLAWHLVGFVLGALAALGAGLWASALVWLRFKSSAPTPRTTLAHSVRLFLVMAAGHLVATALPAVIVFVVRVAAG